MRLLVMLLLIPGLAWGADQLIECPQSLEVKSVASAPDGWHIIDMKQENVLERVGLFSGHPSNGASLVPDKSQTRNGESKDVWAFSPISEEEQWLACFYYGTSLVVAQPVGLHATRCEVRYKVTRAGARLSVLSARCSHR